MALTTTAAVKAFLNKAPTDTTQDNWLDALRLAAEAEIKSFCGRDFEAANYVEFYDGTGHKELALRQIPVTAVNNVWLDFDGAFGTNPAGAFDSSTRMTQGSDYALRLDRKPPWQSTPISFCGVLLRLHYVWAEQGRTYAYNKLTSDVGPALGCIKVDYNAGYPAASIPQDLQLAVAMLCAVWRRILPLGGWVMEEKIGDYLYRLESLRHMQGQYPELGTLFAILNRYRDTAL